MAAQLLNILSWNACSIASKYNELEILANEQEIDIIMIQESRINNKNLPKLQNYTLINKPNGQYLGLITYVKRNLTFSEIDTNTVDSESQIIVINNIAIINYYNIHNSPINTIEIESLLNSHNKSIIIGDFNAQNIAWNNYSTDRNGRILLNYINNSQYLLHHPTNNFTHFPDNNNRPSTIDLAITKNVFINSIICEEDLNSVHLPIKT